MNSQEQIRRKFERIQKALTLKPEMGRHTYVSTTKINQHLSCEITEGAWKISADMPESGGGTGQAPTPGALGRAAIGSCLSIGYMLWAARLEVPITSIEVEIQADDDDGGLFGTSEDPPGYSAVRYLVRVESDANLQDIIRVLDECDKHSPWLDIYTRAIPCAREVQIVGHS